MATICNKPLDILDIGPLGTPREISPHNRQTGQQTDRTRHYCQPSFLSILKQIKRVAPSPYIFSVPPQNLKKGGVKEENLKHF